MIKDTEFYVANILSNTKIIITGGKNQGIVEDDQFGILGSKNIEIKHPITGEILDSLTNTKAVLIVDTIHDKYTVLKTKIASKDQSINSKIARMQLESNTPTREILKVDSRDVKNILSPVSGDKICVGDRVVLISNKK